MSMRRVAPAAAVRPVCGWAVRKSTPGVWSQTRKSRQGSDKGAFRLEPRLGHGISALGHVQSALKWMIRISLAGTSASNPPLSLSFRINPWNEGSGKSLRRTEITGKTEEGGAPRVVPPIMFTDSVSTLRQ